ncbi:MULTISPECIES: hypothetical protein [unclassified Dietzia]|uniref:hypothetical protein n=1 Tax=unclassified Dietzia TaxID=2617939 RepID=UPI000D2194FE|nr:MULTISPECIES: hypothetical protein [unclassified Dietzia]AVZ38707.1 hypothetical protein CT688_03625 [Dietzia sp. JS16-p6b]MBB1024439.1 hypothetical protein [Dietzia sp. DQ12-76]MBB1026440.1 hypothetical protein [Dietzia sp. DQ11-38-2]QGW23803.1 hypothetical protein GJR88_01177 [Dietzia sp. DQ12-45-1b]
MDLVGSVSEIILPIIGEASGSVGEPTGSSAVDTLTQAAFILPGLLLNILGGAGADIGSSAPAF